MDETKERNREKEKYIVWVAIGVTLLAGILILFSKVSANNKRAQEIHNNFLGKSFVGSIEDDDGFVDAYLNGTLNEYMTYWLTTEAVALRFNQDGTIYYASVHDSTALAYPRFVGEPEGYHDEYDGTFSSFSVSVSMDGTVYLKIGSQAYEVTVNSNNVPQTIWDYDEITLNVQ